jgi:hypothetical protein
MQDSPYGILGALSGVGALIGLGQLLLSEEKITLRRALGRAIVTGGLSLGAATILITIPNLGTTAIVGLAAAVASLGAAGLERLIQPIIARYTGGAPK